MVRLMKLSVCAGPETAADEADEAVCVCAGPETAAGEADEADEGGE